MLGDGNGKSIINIEFHYFPLFVFKKMERYPLNFLVKFL